MNLYSKNNIWVASQGVSDVGVAIYLAKSFSALQATGDASENEALIEQLLVDSAYVTIETNNEVFELQKLDDGLYATNEINTINAGQEYFLRASDYKSDLSIEASTVALMGTSFNDLVVLEANNLQPGFTANITIGYSFDDVPGDSKYLVTATEWEGSNGIGSTNDFGIGAGARNFQFLHDETQVENGAINAEVNLTFDPADSLIFSLQTVSEEYFKYLQDRELGGNILTELTGEPVNYDTNIDGGYGFFNLSNISYDFLVVE